MRSASLAIVACLITSCGGAAIPSSEAPTTPLDRVVHDVCKKRMVLLGEDNHHSGGATLALKATLVNRLIDECGFSAVFFEASLPEFIDASRALSAGTASPNHVANAIGGLWSVAAESDPLVTSLFQRAARKQIVLAGLDGQLGSTNRYVPSAMPAELAGYLPSPRRASCQAELERYTRWQYDEASPFDDARRTQLLACLAEIETATSHTRTKPADEATEMAAALHSAITISDPALSTTVAFNTRDQAMYRALQWHVANLPRDTKILVWCATVHAAKTLRGTSDRISLGSFIHRDFADTAASIGISALAGSYGRGNRPATTLAPAPPTSLEARALTGSTALAYLGPAELVHAGVSTARALDCDQLTDAPWHEILDGLLVLREEHPLTYAHDPKPR